MPIKLIMNDNGYRLEMVQKQGKRNRVLAVVEVDGDGPLVDRKAFNNAMEMVMEHYPKPERKNPSFQRYSANNKEN